MLGEEKLNGSAVCRSWSSSEHSPLLPCCLAGLGLLSSAPNSDREQNREPRGAGAAPSLGVARPGWNEMLQVVGGAQGWDEMSFEAPPELNIPSH